MGDARMKFVCRAKDVPENGMRQFEVEGGTKVLVLNSDGEFFACQADCPHQDTPLCEGIFDGSLLTCHHHLWQWDIRTGEPVGMAEEPLPKFEVVVKGDKIHVEID